MGFKSEFGELFLEEAIGPFYLTRGLGVIGNMEFPGDVEALGDLLCDAGDEGCSVVRL